MKDKYRLAIMIMAGGSGTRFWPLSTASKPKQFLTLFGKRSLLQQTFDRVSNLVPVENIFILTNRRHIPLVREQLPQIPDYNLIGEPVRRDTAAAVTLGAVICRQRFGNVTMAVLPADHTIRPVRLFQKTLLSAVKAAENDDALYTFGVVPTYPATGYGYLERGSRLKTEDGIEHFTLRRFKEKPDLDTARVYVESGRFFWNSGIFVWSVSKILEEVQRFLPEHTSKLFPLGNAYGRSDWEISLKRAFSPLPKISIDFGVMEKSSCVRMVRADFEWSDVGGWLALKGFLNSDEDGNSFRGRLMVHSSSENLVFCDNEDETVALVGVKDLVVVRVGRKTLVVHRDRTEEVKTLIEKGSEIDS
nr:mannose-1-phosphate guanylyltransferase [Desulfobacterales bacterium]